MKWCIVYMISGEIGFDFYIWFTRKVLIPEYSNGTLRMEPIDCLHSNCQGARRVNKSSLAIAVSSSASHTARRNAIRETWGKIALKHNITIFFVVGLYNDTEIKNMLQEETRQHNDIVEGQFYDEYENLSQKTQFLLEYFLNKTQFDYLLKVDDDVFVNIKHLKNLLSTLNDTNIIYGTLFKKFKPVRDMESKYFISAQLFQGDYYPDFARGPAYLLTHNSISDLLKESRHSKPFPLEDVYFTGILAEKLNIKRSDVPYFLLDKVPARTRHPIDFIAIHHVGPSAMRSLSRRFPEASLSSGSQ
ncbi:beta-1,3-galactosyltransferase 5-like isoform X2 [Artemia franciscana]|uniref:Hexosyltransferase n=1 Tax=Artemia franciscana TaxID=6661 RepID=A0AA88L7M8_ARTSF|nr:hypothetical protein QYM36_010557 [Artemia franciscana]